MAFNNEIEEVKAQLKVLQSKLSFLEELEKTKSRKEKDYKRVYGTYPNYYNPSQWEIDSWDGFYRGYDMGYDVAQKDYKVGKYQETTQEPEELKTLYQMIDDKKHHPVTCVFICNLVKEWMSQYTHNEMCGEYASGYEDCMLVLEENLK